jgi:hypothetical protein
MEIVFEALVFGDMDEATESQATEMVWGSEELPTSVCKDLDHFGVVQNWDLIFYTSTGWSRRRHCGFSQDLERKAVQSIKRSYKELGLKPKYSEEAFVKCRQSYGSLWD